MPATPLARNLLRLSVIILFVMVIVVSVRPNLIALIFGDEIEGYRNELLNITKFGTGLCWDLLKKWANGICWFVQTVFRRKVVESSKSTFQTGVNIIDFGRQSFKTLKYQYDFLVEPQLQSMFGRSEVDAMKNFMVCIVGMAIVGVLFNIILTLKWAVTICYWILWIVYRILKMLCICLSFLLLISVDLVNFVWYG